MRFRSRSRLLRALAFSASSLALVRPMFAQTVTLSGTELQVNRGIGVGVPTMDGARLRMYDGEYSTARSALSTGTFNLFNAWSTRFRLSFSCENVPGNQTLTDEFGEPLPPEVICPGDGVAFTATSGGAGQVGNGGFGLGYETPGASTDFTNSLAFGMKTFWQFADLGVEHSDVFECDRVHGIVRLDGTALGAGGACRFYVSVGPCRRTVVGVRLAVEYADHRTGTVDLGDEHDRPRGDRPRHAPTFTSGVMRADGSGEPSAHAQNNAGHRAPMRRVTRVVGHNLR